MGDVELEHGPRATALWCRERDTYVLQDERCPAGAEVLVRSRYSAVSRGTERLVLEGRVPQSEAQRMRCPHQVGAFPFPVKYGYALVGEVLAGPEPLAGRLVFALHPHQDVVALAASDVVPLPEGVPARRATLAANMETALNVVWDSGAAPGDRVLVVGCGVVGLLIARLLSRIPGIEVTSVDHDAAKAEFAEAMGARFTEEPPTEVDVAINASGSGGGLATALNAAGVEARVVEASWLGEGTAALPLGGAFHSKRLSIVSSQVGRVPATRVPRWPLRRRLQTAMALLADDALDVLITHEVPFAEAPARLPPLLKDPGPVAIVLAYG